MCNRVAPDIIFFATPFDFLCIILFVIYLFYFHIEHGVGCSDIQMVTRTPGRRKRLIKPFCTFTTTKAPCPQQHPFFFFRKIFWYFVFHIWLLVFGISYFREYNCLVAWTAATKIRDSKGAPSTHICPILPPDLSPDAHLFCPRGTVFVENITPRNLADNFPSCQTVISYCEQHQECWSRRWRSR